MGVYLYPNNTETPLKDAYIGIPNPESIVLDKSSINLTTIGQTEQLTATIEPTVSDHSITWSSDDTTVATVSTTGLVTCVTPGTCTITATTVNGLTATCSVKQGWQPGVNTVVYFPFDTNFNDYSGNGYNLTNNGGVVIESVNGVTCANFKNQSPYGLSRSTGNIITAGPYTYLCRINRTGGGQYNPRIFGGKNDWRILYINNLGKYSVEYPSAGGGIPDSSGRHLICFTGNMSSGAFTSYKDGNLIASGTSSVKGSRTGLVIGANEGSFSEYGDAFIGQMSKVIFENKNWTAQEIADYYDQTKSDYGL